MFDVGWLCFTSHRQRGHLETAPPFTVPCEGREAQKIYRSQRELNPGPSHSSTLHYPCATQAPHVCLNIYVCMHVCMYVCMYVCM